MSVPRGDLVSGCPGYEERGYDSWGDPTLSQGAADALAEEIMNTPAEVLAEEKLVLDGKRRGQDYEGHANVAIQGWGDQRR